MAKKKNTFSIYWIYALLGVSIIAFQLFMGQTETTKVEQNQLLTIADSTYAGVDHVTIINRASPDASAEFSLNKEGVKKILDSKDEELSEIKESLKKSEETDKTKVLFVIENLDPRILAEDLKKQKIEVKYDKRTDYFGGILSYLLPFVIIIAIWIFVMRRMSGGGGGPGGQIFNIGKSKTT